MNPVKKYKSISPESYISTLYTAKTKNNSGITQQMAHRENLQNLGNKRGNHFPNESFNLNGIPEKIKSDKGGAFIPNEYKQFVKTETTK